MSERGRTRDQINELRRERDRHLREAARAQDQIIELLRAEWFELDPQEVTDHLVDHPHLVRRLTR